MSHVRRTRVAQSTRGEEARSAPAPRRFQCATRRTFGVSSVTGTSAGEAVDRRREHPLTHGNGRYDAIDDVRCGVCHASACAARTQTACLARECDEQVVLARVAAGAQKPALEDPAAQIRAKLVAHVFRNRSVVRVARVFEERLEMFAHDAMKQRVLRPARTIRTCEDSHARASACRVPRCA